MRLQPPQNEVEQPPKQFESVNRFDAPYRPLVHLGTYTAYTPEKSHCIA